jgi:hypothetical protein
LLDYIGAAFRENLVHYSLRLMNRLVSVAAIGACLIGPPVSGIAAAGDLDPPTPAAFMPGGMLGIQIGASWAESKRSKVLEHLSCQAVEPKGEVDEVCFFNAPAASRIAGAEIHDGFIVRKDDRVVLIGTGISIKNADDPLAEAVVRSFQSQVHAKYQQTGDDVLFVHMPEQHLTAQQMDGYSQRAPVLLVQLDPKTHRELAVLYGYLAPVNLFGAIGAE